MLKLHNYLSGSQLDEFSDHISEEPAEGAGRTRRRSSRAGHRILCSILSLALAGILTLGTASSQDYVPDQIVVELMPGASIEDVNQRWGTTTIDSFEDDRVHLLNATGLGDLILLGEQMSEDPDVLEAEPNFREDTPEGIRFMVVVPIGGDLVDYEDQSLTTRIELPQAHTFTRGLGVKVAVLDSGVDPDHELFEGRIAPGGYDFVDEDTEPWEESDGIDNDGDEQIDEGFGHGTMVAGLVLLVAPEATILPIRVLDDDGRSDVYRIARAIRYARDQGADVINLSFGSPGGSSTLQSELGYARDSGAVIVSGAGNESREEPAYYPGESSKVIMVTALDSVDVKATFADWNQDVLVSAPGDGVRSAYPGNDWAIGAGCSFATPLVSGVAALVKAVRPTWTAEEAEDHLETAVDPIYHLPGNQPYLDKLGSGRINASLAVQDLVTASVPGVTAPHLFQATPNPSRGSVWFTHSLSEDLPSGVTSRQIVVVDATGRQVRRLDPDAGRVHWDGRDERGRPVPSGLYLYSLGGGVERQKLIVIR